MTRIGTLNPKAPYDLTESIPERLGARSKLYDECVAVDALRHIVRLEKPVQ